MLIDYDISSSPIGVFDSGIGGLTVARAIKNLLPHENIVYFGDIARLPYGTKSVSTIKRFASETAHFLVKQKVKAIVIACNTIAAVARDEVMTIAKDLPVIDVLSSGAAEAVTATINNKIGIIATPATIKSNAYPHKIMQINNKIQVFSMACGLFVPFIEEGLTTHSGLKLVAKDYLNGLLDNNIDTLVLGCTHYPLMVKIIQEIVGDNIRIIDPAVETSVHLKKTLSSSSLLNKSHQQNKSRFFVTEQSIIFDKILHDFLGYEQSSKLVNLEE